jgi:hypothetical protein
MIWATDHSSMNCWRVIHCLRSTISRCTIAITPPKPCSAMKEQDQNRSASEAGRGRAGGASGAVDEGGTAESGMGELSLAITAVAPARGTR